MYKHILVTGGAGFIGSRLCKSLSKKYKVTSIDTYFNGTTENHSDNVEYIKMSTKDIKKLKFVPDLIVHLGEYSRVEQSFEDIDFVHDNNINGTFEILEFARKNDIRVIYSSTSSSFSSEDLSPYTLFKKQNVELIKSYNKWFNLDYSIMHFYNVYGEDKNTVSKYSTVIEIFKNQYKNKLPLTITGDGLQERNFTHIDDIVNGIILVIEKGKRDDYMIGDTKTTTILELAKMFGSNIIFKDDKPGNRKKSILDTTKIKKLGFKVNHNLKDFIEEYKNR